VSANPFAPTGEIPATQDDPTYKYVYHNTDISLEFTVVIIATTGSGEYFTPAL